ncbi:restriction endonuclease subunit S [Aureispira sp. CCB-QB1]|uniref:restriction endonuclease subunit S n=1 Tax=Aureispira sp. CCB-QB1 TaxID=1313421 RepID=UPI000698F7EA|nr:restriction endonuclease subunit S [Aureispira sp. CCB-QB1]
MKLEQIASLRTGVTFREGVKQKEDGDTYLIQMKDVSEDFKRFENSIRVDGSIFKPKHFLKQKDILFIAKGQHNKAILYDKGYEKACGLSLFIIIHPNQEMVLPEYLVWYLNQSMAQRQLERFKEGTATTSIGIKSLKGLEITLPPLVEQEKLVELIKLKDREEAILEQIKEKRLFIINSLIKLKIIQHD